MHSNSFDDLLLLDPASYPGETGQPPVVIDVSGVSKTYQLKKKPFSLFGGNSGGSNAETKATHNALNQVTLSIRKGETVGLLGVNGAGKSTLLQIITGTLQPTTGIVRTIGSISALLQLGAGFNPEWTGRANAEFQCIMQGIAKNDLAKTIQSIEEFADIGAYFDQPTRTYSSGMFLRVAFASAVATAPDILIVDEALAVGDVLFQNKCFRRFEEMQANGCTILFVTHSPDLVARFCSRGILLNKGAVVFDGSSSEAVQEYMLIMMGTHQDQSELSQDETVPVATGPVVTGPEPEILTVESDFISKQAADLKPLFDRFEKRLRYNPEEKRSGHRKATIIDAFFHLGDFKEFLGAFEPGSDVSLTVRIDFTQPVRCPEFGMTFRTVSNQILSGATNWIVSEQMPDIEAPCTVYMTWKFKMNFLVGTYLLDLGASEIINGVRAVQDSRQSVFRVDVQYTTRCFGTTFINPQIEDVVIAPLQAHL